MGGKLEEIECNLCGSSNTRPVGLVALSEDQQHILSLQELTLVQCEKCGLAYTDPRPSERVLEELYDVGYRDLAERNIEKEVLVDRRLTYCGGGYVTYDLAFCERTLRDLTRLVKAKGKMLDVGCGEGRFIKFARDNGWEVLGQEFSHEAAKRAQRRFKLDVKAGDLRELGFPRDYFDVVIMLNVIEHLADPLGYLNEINRILKRGGVLYLGTPNVVLTKRCMQLSVPEHLYRFSIDSMKRMLEKSGFSVVRLTTRNKQDSLVGFDLLKHHLLSPNRYMTDCVDMKTYISTNGRLMAEIIGAALGVRLYKWGVTANGGARITAFANKA